MVQFAHVIEDAEGLHARPVAFIASEAHRWISTARVSCANGTADATDLMGLMGLDARCGDELTITVEGPDEEAAAAALQKVFSF